MLICLQLTQEVMEEAEERRPEYAGVCRLELPQGQKHRVERCLLASRICEVSQDWLAGRIREDMLFLDSPVEDVWEVRYTPYATDDRGHCNHSVFWVLLKAGPAYIFDPTGVQFGPEWAVLQEAGAYIARRVYKVEPEHVRPLGTRRIWYYPEIGKRNSDSSFLALLCAWLPFSLARLCFATRNDPPILDDQSLLLSPR
jgi:hypothetical protein